MRKEVRLIKIKGPDKNPETPILIIQKYLIKKVGQG
jgi:hypothetical protein